MDYPVLFGKFIIPAGAATTLCYVSGFESLVKVAGVLMNSPIRVQKVQISLALFLTGLCAVMSLFAYSSCKRHESDIERHQARFAFQTGLEDQLMRNKFASERNFWMSMLALALWVVSWRLKTLFDSKHIQIAPAVPKEGGTKWRIIYAVIAVLCAILADIPMCRLNYTLQIHTYITPTKGTLTAFSKANGCAEANLGSSTGECANYCSEVRKLSEDRQWAIMWTRNWHPTGKFAAEIFDGIRRQDQGEGKVDKLFEDRSCDRVLASIDKSNTMVNMSCIAMAAVAIIGCLVGLQNALAASPPGEVAPTMSVGLPARGSKDVASAGLREATSSNMPSPPTDTTKPLPQMYVTATSRKENVRD